MNSITRIGQWDCFERSIIHTSEYADPYRNVTLHVTYTKPDGTELKFWGFYDGEQTWKIRCLPDQLGRWSYHAEFSDGSRTEEGEFECNPSELPGQIHKDEANPIWFGFRGGKRALIRSFHVGDRFFASNFAEEDRIRFLNWLQENGYNTISAASHYVNRQTPGRGAGWDTPKLWPLDYSEYRRMETILDELRRREIIVFPFAGFFGREAFFPNAHRDQELYVRYTIARLGAYWNVLFNVAGPEPLMKNNPFALKEDVDRWGRLIRAYNTFGQLMTVHNAVGDATLKDETYIDYVTLQGPKVTDRQKLYDGLMRNRKEGCPLYAQETLWPGNVWGHQDYTLDDVRKNAYVIQMAAAALNYGDFDGDSSSGFSGSMNLEQLRPERHELIRMVWDFMEELPFQSMKPAPELTTAGYCLAAPGKAYVVYVEQGGALELETKPAVYRVEWINARNTQERLDGGTTDTGKGLRAPDHEDWLLVLSVIE